MSSRRSLLLGLGLLLSSPGFSESDINHFFTPTLTPENAPWFTGPLLAPSARTMPPKHVNVEPYVYFTTFTGSYNAHWRPSSSENFYSLLQQTFIQVGVTDFIDVQLAPQVFSQWTKNKQSTQIGDLPLILDIQLYKDRPGTRWPAVKLILRGAVPFGKYQHLNPSLLGTDGVGLGSWLPTVGLAFARLYQLPNQHFFAPRFSFNYVMPLCVPVKGLSVYGGAEDTNGKIYPGNFFWTDFGFEYTLTKRWVLAMDLFYQHSNKSRFFGNPGTVPSLLGPVPASIGGASSESISLAPAIEYNWNINVGLIAGVWFTAFGRNTARFASGVLAVNIYI